MSKIEDDITKAEYLIDNPAFYRKKDDIFDMLYPFTTENINGMFSHFNFKNKDCLSVLGSSNQVFDMYLRGAKSVTSFDINPLTKYLFYLKRAALDANLTKEEYLDYFCQRGIDDYTIFDDDSIRPFDIKIFDKIVPYLKGNSYKFWTSLYDKYSFSTIRDTTRLFTIDEYFRDILENMKITLINLKKYLKTLR